MSRDRVYVEELKFDTSGVNAGPFLKAALDSIVEDLLAGEKVRGLGWMLHDFIGGQVDVGELCAAAIISGDFASFRDMIEGRLRRELEDADITHDLAAELARDDE